MTSDTGSGRDDRFTERARELLEAKLLSHPDEGVRAITALLGVPDEAVERVAAKLRAEVAALAEMPDSEIDCGDIPETTDWSGAERGRFSAPNPQVNHRTEGSPE